MDRNQFGQLLRSIIVPENISPEEYKRLLMPIAEAIMAMLPEKLYRYRSCSTLNMDAFDKDLVYAVTADKFNDPYDTLIKYNAGNLGQMFKESFIGISEMIRKISTIACFSETVQSVTMWSHYADNHEGYALESDLRFIPTDGNSMGCFIFPVVYDDNRFEATDLIAWCFAKCYGRKFSSYSKRKQQKKKLPGW